ncbi:MAG: DUF308 domain-containing protein [Lachnospiraceae bacterium]|nr:DUF308 domain-containing protein [Lachnospiraceae bacterium]
MFNKGKEEKAKEVNIKEDNLKEDKKKEENNGKEELKTEAVKEETVKEADPKEAPEKAQVAVNSKKQDSYKEKEGAEGVKFKREMYTYAAAYILVGLWMVLFPQFTLDMVCYLIAAVITVVGVFDIILYFRKDIKTDIYRNDFAQGLILILIAILLVWKSQLFINIMPVIMGIVIFSNGVLKLQRVIDLKRIGFNGWIYVLIFALLCISLGIFVMLEPDFIARAVMIVIGISLVFSGITDVVTLLIMGRHLKKLYQEANAVDTVATVEGEEPEIFEDTKEDNDKRPARGLGKGVRREKSELLKAAREAEKSEEKAPEAHQSKGETIKPLDKPEVKEEKKPEEKEEVADKKE